MPRAILPALLFVVSAGLMHAAPVPKKPKVDYQKLADETEWKYVTFSFKETLATELKGYEVTEEQAVDGSRDLVIHISDDKKELLLAWKTHGGTESFAQRNGVFYYTDHSPYSSGCSVVAFDLDAKKQLWKTELKGLGPIDHSKYRNAVRLEVLDDETLRVFGKESSGRYVEIVDRGTGKTVGHKLFDEKN